MAKKITEEEILLINELYSIHGTYSKVAQLTGRAPSTVKKYIIQSFENNKKNSIEKVSLELIKKVENFIPTDILLDEKALLFSEEELQEIAEIAKGLVM